MVWGKRGMSADAVKLICMGLFIAVGWGFLDGLMDADVIKRAGDDGQPKKIFSILEVLATTGSAACYVLGLQKSWGGND
ncbi:MAG: hypothetical protein CMH54_11045 [Myxococcales bacterium]|nr:hypothetical protein [Myxococcales bacterium]|tara:strand:- start:2387 stop:2623 length:237 start_codon:yes stop_codon:yes gene_type:complete